VQGVNYEKRSGAPTGWGHGAGIGKCYCYKQPRSAEQKQGHREAQSHGRVASRRISIPTKNYMTSENNQIAVAQPFVKASTQLSTFLGIETSMMLDTLKAQCFKGLRPEQVSDAQLAAFVSVCNVQKLNPLIPGMVYAYPERNGGITPIVGPDGTFKKLDEHIAEGKLSGYECIVYPEDGSGAKPTHATATIFRKDAPEHPARYTAYFSEWNVSSNPNWQQKPRHMLWLRAIKQAARQVIHGLPMDADEYKLSQMLNVTESEGGPEAQPEPQVERATAKERKGVKKAQEVVVTEEQQKAAEPAKVVEAAPVEDVQAAMKAREAKMAATVAPKPEAKAEVIEEAKPATRLFIGENEVIDVVAKVEKCDAIVATMQGKPTPILKATVSGGFVGELRHKEGAEFGQDGKTAIKCQPWYTGGEFKFKLIGKKSPAPEGHPQYGKIFAWVSEIAVIAKQAQAVDEV